MCSNLDRQNLAKKIVQGRGKNVAEQRTVRRLRLIEKFKSLRIQAIDSFRKLKEGELTYEILCEVKKQLSSTLDQRVLLEADELSNFLRDLEEELVAIKLQENEYYEKLYFDEVETITNNLMNKCDLCDDLIVDSGICEPCTKTYVTHEL